jgi:hypothetical protein
MHVAREAMHAARRTVVAFLFKINTVTMGSMQGPNAHLSGTACPPPFFLDISFTCRALMMTPMGWPLPGAPHSNYGAAKPAAPKSDMGSQFEWAASA